jgi:hypothetical protein
MTYPINVFAHTAKFIGAACIGAGAIAGLSCGVANADVDEVAPRPTVTSRQASENSVIRINDFGVAGGISEARLGDAGIVSAQGEVRDSTMAVVGTTVRPFRGGFPNGPGMGEW